MDKKSMTFLAVLFVTISVGFFYGGMTYEKSKSPAKFRDKSNFPVNFEQNSGNQKRPNEERVGTGGNNSRDGMTMGEIISRDEKSITVKIRDGGSKIVYFSDSTSIGKSTQGNESDLGVGQQIMINGKSSPDGSIAAQNIQIRSE